jgi:ATP-dependent helicase HepA
MRSVVLRHGQFVLHPRVPGIGRVSEQVGNEVRVEAFESVATPIAETWWLPIGECRPVTLSRQTRVYWLHPDTGVWTTGRVVAADSHQYAIRVPNAEFDVQVPMEELRVRWNRQVASPVEVLAAGANESPFFSDARLPMLRSLVDQRAASSSLSAALSSAIEIYPHQIDVALTVLSDPVQRYLLADEVGLGKTIEAGLVIRQHLIDYPTSQIAVLAPDLLRRQWRDELVNKFFIDDFPRATVRIARHETPERWPDYHGFDLVVIDEVHHLTRAGNPDAEPYPQLAALARSTPRLLLLSATPATARPEHHLGLLHLLDPDLYRWADVTAFTRRFHDRRKLANAAHGLDANFEMLLPDVLNDIAALIPADPSFRALAADVSAFLTEDDELRDESERAQLGIAVETLRAHIGETYRLHRRMIRHRRSHVLQEHHDDLLPFEVTGRRRPEPFTVGRKRADQVGQALLDWQQQVARWLLDHPTDDADERQRAYGQVLAVLATRLSELSDDLVDALRWRVDGDADAAGRADLSSQEREILRGTPVLAFEADTLARLVDGAGVAVLTLDGLTSAIAGCRRPVIFCGPGELATVLGEELAESSRWAVLQHTAKRDPADVVDDLRRWRRGGAVLLVDGSGEDGLNLQDADVLVHLRLPWSPNRLEQRLGRVDRFAGVNGAGVAAAQHVETGGDPEESFAAAWRALLVAGFGAFDDSLSALQDILDELQAQVWAVGLSDGPAAMLRTEARIIEALAHERREIEGMDALESVQHVALGHQVARRIGISEMRWQHHERALRGFAGDAPGGLRFSVRPSTGQIATFGVDTETPPLVSPLLLGRVGALPTGSARGAFNRNVSLREPGLRLFRLGNPLVTLLADVIAVDDRGQASAMWRPGLSGDVAVYFGFNFVIEADLDGAQEIVGIDASAALRRQADRLLPPYTDRLWLPTAGTQPVTDAVRIAWLTAPYGRGDLNLNADRLGPLLDVFAGRERFADAARDAERTARDVLASSADLRTRTATAYEAATRELAVRRTQALARQSAGRLLSDTESYAADVEVSAALIEGVRQPRIRVVAASCVVGGDLGDGGRGTR